MTTGPTYGLDDWFLSTPACVGVLILTIVASVGLSIVFKKRQEVQGDKNVENNKDRIFKI